MQFPPAGGTLRSRRFSIITSDRPSALMDRLADDLRAEPLSSPLRDECIVVQSLGMERWVRLELARRHGCAASLRMPFPAAFSHWIAAQVERELADAQARGARTIVGDERFDRDVMAWRIHALLEQGIAEEAEFAPLRGFLERGDARQRAGLANRIADRLDEYLLFRPDLLLAWERGEGTADELDAVPHARWQRALWRRLTAGESPRHLSRRFFDVIRELEGRASRGEPAPAGLPERVSVFGVSSLPPLFVELLHALSRFVPVRAYVAAPPRRSWPVDGGASGHVLFASLGGQVRELLGLLDGEGAEWDELDEPPATNGKRPSSLHALQADIRAGVVRGVDAPPLPIHEDDDSLRVHVCHSPMREMEVLRDQLLDAFATDPTLRPHDVLVLVPDITVYAPYVSAIFGAGEQDVPTIPFRLADRPLAQEHALAGAMLRLVRLAGGRRTAGEILELLDVPAVRAAAGLLDDPGERLLAWVRETRICWGRDGRERQELHRLPAVDANSWRAGIERLLMGYATGPVDDVVGGIFPAAGHTVGDPALLGAFADWLDRLFATLADWRKPRSLDAWRTTLLDTLETFFAAESDEEERALELVRAQVERLGRARDLAVFDRTVELPLVREWLDRALGDDSFGAGFLSGGMTVSALKPMRSIPFRVIAVAGLDDRSFPRHTIRQAFDLAAIAPRPGDRDARVDDRQIFLDVLMAAQDRLILSYVGRSAKDNKERAASVVVAELLDCVDRSFRTGRERPARECVVVHHRLQPFSPAYYEMDGGDQRLFSYSRANARATAAAAGERTESAPFVTAAIATAPYTAASTHLELRLADLIDCWTNPSRFFCRTTLGLQLVEGEEAPEDVEPMVVDELTRYLVHDGMLRRHLGGTRDLDREYRELVARGELPPGELTRAWHRKLARDLVPLLDRIGSPAFREPVSVLLRGAGWSVTGQLDQLTTDGWLQLRPATVKSKDLVRAWITHLALNACGSPDLECIPRQTTVHGTEKIVRLAPLQPADAVAALDSLVAGYRECLTRPLPVFEKASFAYADQERKLRTSARASKPAIECAREAFESRTVPGAERRGDDADAYVQLCTRGRDPFGEDSAEFIAWSTRLWAPMLACMTEEKP